MTAEGPSISELLATQTVEWHLRKEGGKGDLGSLGNSHEAWVAKKQNPSFPFSLLS